MIYFYTMMHGRKNIEIICVVIKEKIVLHQNHVVVLSPDDKIRTFFQFYKNEC